MGSLSVPVRAISPWHRIYQFPEGTTLGAIILRICEVRTLDNVKIVILGRSVILGRRSFQYSKIQGFIDESEPQAIAKTMGYGYSNRCTTATVIFAGASQILHHVHIDTELRTFPRGGLFLLANDILITCRLTNFNFSNGELTDECCVSWLGTHLEISSISRYNC